MTEREEFAKLGSIESCPVCGKALERGYVITEGLRWDRSKRKLFVGSARRLGPLPWTLNNFPSLKCETCELVIFDFGSHAK